MSCAVAAPALVAVVIQGQGGGAEANACGGGSTGSRQPSRSAPRVSLLRRRQRWVHGRRTRQPGLMGVRRREALWFQALRRREEPAPERVVGAVRSARSTRPRRCCQYENTKVPLIIINYFFLIKICGK